MSFIKDTLENSSKILKRNKRNVTILFFISLIVGLIVGLAWEKPIEGITKKHLQDNLNITQVYESALEGINPVELIKLNNENDKMTELEKEVIEKDENNDNKAKEESEINEKPEINRNKENKNKEETEISKTNIEREKVTKPLG